MKKLLFILAFIATVGTALAQTNSSYRYQSGYYKPSTGTYVQPHHKTNSNWTNWDNYSTKSNTNPWTGTSGYRARDYSSGAYNYGGGRTIYTGPRGGQYYYNSYGNKTYVPKRY
jgi:Ni/Co efflux regulator RcnB